MINSIEGHLTSLSLTDANISTGSGIEFSIMISGQTSSAIAPYIGKDEKIKLFTILIHREDTMKLVGFKDKLERELFEELTSISGIGTKQALKILSGFSSREFISLLDKGDVKRLATIPGLGLKTAQKILIMLREKLVEIETVSAPVTRVTSPALVPYIDIIASVSEMGYQKDEVKEALERLLESNKDELRGLNDTEREKKVFRLLLSELSNG